MRVPTVRFSNESGKKFTQCLAVCVIQTLNILRMNSKIVNPYPAATCYKSRRIHDRANTYS